MSSTRIIIQARVTEQIPTTLAGTVPAQIHHTLDYQRLIPYYEVWSQMIHVVQGSPKTYDLAAMENPQLKTPTDLLTNQDFHWYSCCHVDGTGSGRVIFKEGVNVVATSLITPGKIEAQCNDAQDIFGQALKSMEIHCDNGDMTVEVILGTQEVQP